MKLVIFGLTISSSWGNGHATLWRGLCRALGKAGHDVVFFEQDAPYYRAERDLLEIEGGRLVLYPAWGEVKARAARELGDADVGIVTSYCPDAVVAGDLLAGCERPLKVFYDLDTPVTLAAIEDGKWPSYLSPAGLGQYELVLSYTGGLAPELLRERLGARRVGVLYGHVDPGVHRPHAPQERFRADLCYLGTYAADRQARLEELFMAPARLCPARRFVLGGSMYPDVERFPPNLVHYPHVPPGDHAAFFGSARMTLNVTRDAMARLGHCPSGRLFEAAAAGVPLISDWFDGLDAFFEPQREIGVVFTHSDVLAALAASERELAERAARARDRVLGSHTAAHRAGELEHLLAGAWAAARRGGSFGGAQPLAAPVASSGAPVARRASEEV